MYNTDFCDIVAIDVSEHTNISNDYRYVETRLLERDSNFSNKLKVHQKKQILEKKLEILG